MPTVVSGIVYEASCTVLYDDIHHSIRVNTQKNVNLVKARYTHTYLREEVAECSACGCGEPNDLGLSLTEGR